MPHHAFLFLILAVGCSILGFTGLAAHVVEIAQFLSVLFVALFVVTLGYALLTRRKLQTPKL